MPRKIYVELSRYVRESARVVVEVPDEFPDPPQYESEPQYFSAETLHKQYNDSGGDWHPDYEMEPIQEEYYFTDDTPDAAAEVDISLLNNEDDAA